jgi:hypothetical protein
LRDVQLNGKPAKYQNTQLQYDERDTTWIKWVKPSAPQDVLLVVTLPVIPNASETQIPGPNNPVTWNAKTET